MQNQKIVDSGALSLFMRYNLKCNNTHISSASLSIILLFSSPEPKAHG